MSRYRNKWEHFKAVKKGSTSEFNYYEAEISGLSWFAIGDYDPESALLSEEAGSEEVKKGVQPIDFLIAMLTLILIFGVSAYNNLEKQKMQGPSEKDQAYQEIKEMLNFIQDNNLEDDPHYIIIDVNDEKKVNLGKYFIDPDEDNLELRAISSPKNITIIIKNGRATFIPDKGFIGVRKVSFFATDGKNFAVSDEFYIIVKE